MRSPATTTSAFGSTLRTSSTKPRTASACRTRWVSEVRAGGWKRLSRPWSPPLELKWLATTKTGRPWKENWPARGLRLFAQAALPGSIRPGEAVRRGLPWEPVTLTGVEASPPAMSVNETRAGL